ncbi:UDP-N-acetylglucosamine 2-epimerase [Desulforhopalus sp. 52FAK]
MKTKRKICVITGTRAEYGLLYWLMKEIDAAEELKLQLVVTGTHLSSEFGLTYKQIEQDHFEIDCKVEMLLSSDTTVGISKSMGLAMIGFAEAFEKLSPDIIVVLGDRYEIFCAAASATVARIPIAHLHGGERTEGAIDESFRHSITKMSHLHFTATDEYRRRVIQMGEHGDRVFNVGAAGIDNIKRLTLLSRAAFEESIGFNLGSRNLFVTFHPVTLEKSTAEAQFQNLLSVLDELDETHLFFTKANADTDGRIINGMIDDYVMANRTKAIAHISLGQLRYLSGMQYVDGVIGNSSSGLLEAPSFRIGSVNIGDRQKGRIKADSVIDCDTNLEDIRGALSVLFSSDFREKLKTVVNPYGDGGVATKIVEVLRKHQLNGILKKKFNDHVVSS